MSHAVDRLEALATVADKSPSVQTVSDLAVALGEAGAWDEAMETFQDALDLLQPGDAHAHLHLADRLAAAHLHGHALELFVRYLALRDGFALGETAAIDVVLARESMNDAALPALPALTYTVRFLVAYENETRKNQPVRLPPRQA